MNFLTRWRQPQPSPPILRVRPVNPDLLKKELIAVSSEGDLVVIQLGNVVVKVPYETGLLLSQWIRIRAKEAKEFAGDKSRHWSAIGQLHDANNGPGVTRG